jgi:hypothetical protein
VRGDAQTIKLPDLHVSESIDPIPSRAPGIRSCGC